MPKKNHDSQSFNRTGLFDYEKMTILYEDKNGTHTFDLKAELDKLDGLEISLSCSTEVPAATVDGE
ncbi:YonK family protein [Paenibacillus chitinolyticus]|uniref:YonK family protein n=1 Tax=Paenibacillus chitinolyticus TaxID=79263 RepID=UPI00366D7D18